MILSKKEVFEYLDCIKSLQRDQPLFDLHVSPFEVIFESFHYVPNQYHEGVHSLQGVSYKPPAVQSLRIQTPPKESSAYRKETAPTNLSIMLYRQCFANIGTRVLKDHMRLCGISKSLLLPVVQPESDGEEQFRLMYKIYCQDEQIMWGFCIPNTVTNKKILSVVKTAISDYGIKVIKLHPNITGINLSTDAGRQRVENILDACRLTSLPLVVHGGFSPVLKNPSFRGYAALTNLCQIDWSITPTPVVISHAGMMGHPLNEIKDLIPVLLRILSIHNNVFIDVSALDSTVLCLLVEKIDRKRIVFGSDAFYFPQWCAVVKLFHALRQTASDAEEAFIEMAGKNPTRYIFRH